jgi:hypothetical protein
MAAAVAAVAITWWGFPCREFGLGKVIQALKPGANAGAGKKKAEKQAKNDMNRSNG